MELTEGLQNGEAAIFPRLLAQATILGVVIGQSVGIGAEEDRRLDAARAQLAQAGQQADYTVVRAPYAGVVAQMKAAVAAVR